ncbi:zf-HC2 domain-containing protein [Saccharothrix lopnurensis]|uniref:Zf-HC2 domain-containing protein n=1 Tax=Saccharothrix lopnurensis TaxID=1670621 RepID=A0ABW1NWM3_9PSEU
MADNVGVDCDTCREALSARLDGEGEPVPAAETDAHLAGCAACRAWEGGAAAVTRSLRLRPATPTPDLATAVLDAAPPPVRTEGWYARGGLAAVAVAQLTLGLSQLLGAGAAAARAAGHGAHGPGPDHLFNEGTAWNLALGVGLLWAALKPRAAGGLLPVVAAFVVVLGAFSAWDLVTGQATVTRVTSHAILVLALVALVVVRRGHRGPGGGVRADTGSGAGLDPADEQADDPEQADERADGTRPARRTRLRPVSRRRAA